MMLGPPGVVGDLQTGSDVPNWARVETWTVSRWSQVLTTWADRLGERRTTWTGAGPQLVRTGMVTLPGLGAVPVGALAALVHRTVTVTPVRGLAGWARYLLQLEPVPVRQARCAWRLRLRVVELLHAEVNHRLARHADLHRDLFQ